MERADGKRKDGLTCGSELRDSSKTVPVQAKRTDFTSRLPTESKLQMFTQPED